MRQARLDIPKELQGIIVQTNDTLHGAPRFAGTRVFVYQLFDYVLTGRSLDEFLKDFEGVRRDHADAVMKWQLDRIHAQLAS